MMAPGVDLVVVNYKTPQDLIDFICSFAEVQTEVPCSLTIMDLQPTQTDFLRVFKLLNARLSVPRLFWDVESNIGYAAACNDAAALLKFGECREVVAFFNADTRLRPGVLDGCYRFLQDNANVAVVGPKQVDDHGLITHAGIYGTNERPSFRGRWKVPDTGQYADNEDCLSVSGSAYFVLREAWDALAGCDLFQRAAPSARGAFLPTPHYYEETYLSLHARHHGWRVVYLGQYSMIHKWHQASPVGEIERKIMPQSRELFRVACDAHGIAHE